MSNRPPTAASAISSAMSDDEDGNMFTKKSAPDPRPTQTEPVVITQGYTQIRNTPTPTSRPDSSRPPYSAVGPASSIAGSSRPQSPASQISRTHVPSLTAHGFFRPMSSQRLQAQRLGRPQHVPHAVPVTGRERMADNQSETGRSISTMQGPEPFAPLPEDEQLEMSRGGTEYTQSVLGERTVDSDFNVQTMPRRRGPAMGFFDEKTANATRMASKPPERLHLGNNLQVGASQDPAQKSPRSFKTGFSLGSRRHRSGLGHEHLSSTGTAPPYDEVKVSTPPAVSKATGKNFEYFEGNTSFWMGGRLQNARDRPVNICTGLVLVLPAILFFIFSAPYLWHHVSPAIPLVFAYLFFVTLSSFIHASVVDPGILPRHVHPFPEAEPNSDPLALGPPQNDWVMVRLATSDTAAMDVPVKHCKTCNIWRPPRTYHCRVCDNCVETLDHHCVWLNNCVGRRNYRYFFAFVSSATVLALYLTFASLGHCIAYHRQEGVSFRKALDECRVPFAMFIYGILGLPYPASLLFYHLFLMGRGETTREYLNSQKFAKVDRHRPFTQGSILRNLIVVLARPKPPTYLHFKKDYEEGDQRFGPRRGQRQPTVKDMKEGGMEMTPVQGSQKVFEGPAGRSSEPGDRQ